MKDRTAVLAAKAVRGDSDAFGELYSLFSSEMFCRGGT